MLGGMSCLEKATGVLGGEITQGVGVGKGSKKYG